MDPLAEMIRAKITSGALPRATDSVNTWFGGRGTGRKCRACESSIPAFDVEVEIEFQDGSTLCFHWACYRTWDKERQRS
jgi:hypothetical protein